MYAGQKTELILEPLSGSPDHDRAMIPEGADCVVKQEDTDYVRIADPDQDRKTIKIYNNVDREKITARKEKIFLPGNCRQKPDFWWILICWRQLRLREYGTLLYIEDLGLQ